ncbi:hypothetical protein CEXT_436681 [Caerostris extrusa]|uniref:Uncharacterized protein n=1 Tax=Caerostris extrusa TaxID=172846 RepID=A0AAV4NLM8_CAEEX|nr:hypothetical protein CEXT_436681 [Caerostris extrusa]
MRRGERWYFWLLRRACAVFDDNPIIPGFFPDAVFIVLPIPFPEVFGIMILRKWKVVFLLLLEVLVFNINKFLLMHLSVVVSRQNSECFSCLCCNKIYVLLDVL